MSGVNVLEDDEQQYEVDVDGCSEQGGSTSDKNDIPVQQNSNVQVFHPAFFKDYDVVTGDVNTPAEMVLNQSQQMMNTQGSSEWTSQDFIQSGLASISRKAKKRLPNGKFAKTFSFSDEEKILKALSKNGYTHATIEFWSKAGASLELSVTVEKHSRIYEKVRRLREKYIKKSRMMKRNPQKTNDEMSQEEARLYELSKKIWGKEAQAEEEEEEEEEEYNLKYEKFAAALRKYDVHFPVIEALKLVPASKRSKLEKKWKDLNAQLCMRRIDLIQEIMGAVVSSPSFPSAP